MSEEIKKKLDEVGKAFPDLPPLHSGQDRRLHRGGSGHEPGSAPGEGRVSPGEVTPSQ